jgi:1L-myo-inositol 1-phosphate cytidylyltransferase
MDAVILAAGYGSRLQAVSPCKPLTPVAGVPLIELGVRQAARAGAERIIVVTGHRAELLEKALPAIGERAGVIVEPIRVDDWSKPNGYSVLAGAAHTSGDYLLMMADHIFSDSVLSRLVESRDSAMAVTLAIDRWIDNPLVDPEDATWVETGDHGAIRAIGKTLVTYNAVDCGAFYATAGLADGIRSGIASGATGSLSDGMQRLADAGQAGTVDIGAAWWMDVDDPRAHALAEAQAPLALQSIFREVQAGSEPFMIANDD